MSDTQEPTMEEILASIRRIISEDDVPAAPEAETAEPASMRTSPVAAAVDDDVLELTEPLEPVHAPPPLEPPVAAAPPPPPPPPKPAPSEPLSDLDAFASSPPPAPAPAYIPAPPAPEEPLLGSYAAQSTAGHFGALARTVAMPKEGRSLEDVVRELLRPMLRDWLDQNLPGIVEARVQAEVERISRRHDY